MRVCGDVRAGLHAAKLGFAPTFKDVRNNIPAGYAPSDLQKAYSLTPYSNGNGSGETVAIVDAYDDPNAASDLASTEPNMDCRRAYPRVGASQKKSMQPKARRVGPRKSRSTSTWFRRSARTARFFWSKQNRRSPSALSTAEKYATAMPT